VRTEIHGDLGLIFLRVRKREGENRQEVIGLVDAADMPLILNHVGSWYISKSETSFYINGRSAGINPQTGRQDHIELHRAIMQPPDDMVVDHINGNGLDNRRKNLRIATHLENKVNCVAVNKQNKSGYRGVSWHPTAKKWVAQFAYRGADYNFGFFSDVRVASIAAEEGRRLVLEGTIGNDSPFRNGNRIKCGFRASKRRRSLSIFNYAPIRRFLADSAIQGALVQDGLFRDLAPLATDV
jgi:hypothetical protein